MATRPVAAGGSEGPRHSGGCVPRYVGEGAPLCALTLVKTIAGLDKAPASAF